MAWTADDQRRLTAPTLLVPGDTDFVRVEHAAGMRELIPDARLAMLPDTTHTALTRRTGGQNTDRPVRVVNRSRAATPATELPRSSRPGLHTHRVQRPGTTAMIPPPTPLLPGRPTR